MTTTLGPPTLGPAPTSTDPTIADLERTWRGRPGLWGWLTSTDHKSIGKRYLVTAFAFFLLGGLEAALMRCQLARPEHGVVGPDLYNQLFSMHGTTRMFLFAVPIMTAFGLYFVPLMIGTRNVAFPRLNAYGYWIYLFGGLLRYGSFVLNIGPDTGWVAYVPLSGPAFFIILFAMPWIAMASIILAMDRLVATHFFNPAEGGDALLWQHRFWFFGHPEVYISFVPALGFVSQIVATDTRRQVFGYPAVVLALLATGVLSFGLGCTTCSPPGFRCGSVACSRRRA